jgi:hypothetical protein
VALGWKYMVTPEMGVDALARPRSYFAFARGLTEPGSAIVELEVTCCVTRSRTSDWPDAMDDPIENAPKNERVRLQRIFCKRNVVLLPGNQALQVPPKRIIRLLDEGPA